MHQELESFINIIGSFICCFVCLWSLDSYSKVGAEIEGEWERTAEGKLFV